MKTKAFEDAFLGFYGVNYLKVVGLSVSNSINNKWIINFFRENSKHHTYALEFILMARFLFGSFENFIYETVSKERLNIVVSSVNKKTLVDSKSLELHRNKWLEAIQKEPDKGRDVVRKTNESTYNWLHTHDDEWLKEHLPNKLPNGGYKNDIVNWPERDKTLANQVNSIVVAIKTAVGNPRKVTELEICKALECKSILINNRDKLPLTNKAIKDSIETVEQFRLRRCYWIIDTQQAQGIQPTVIKVLTMLHVKENRSEWKGIIEEILLEKGI